jgi:hypothetical protein
LGELEKASAMKIKWIEIRKEIDEELPYLE